MSKTGRTTEELQAVRDALTATPVGADGYAGVGAPTACAAGVLCLAGTAAANATASMCPAGGYCPAGVFVACDAGSYNPLTAQTASSACATCPAGSYCPSGAITPTACAAGSYNPNAGGTSSDSACTVAPAGSYAAAGATWPTLCGAGTYRAGTGGVGPQSCAACSLGTYSTAQGAVTACPQCAAGSYCMTPSTIAACPVNTLSAAGAKTQLDCQCLPGFSCTFTKKISTVVTLANVTLEDFNNDVGGVRTAFIASMAAAAGVPVSQVSIVNVVSTGGGRRLLGVKARLGGVEVHSVVRGAMSVRSLRGHLRGHVIVGEAATPRHAVVSWKTPRK